VKLHEVCIVVVES